MHSDGSDKVLIARFNKHIAVNQFEKLQIKNMIGCKSAILSLNTHECTI